MGVFIAFAAISRQSHTINPTILDILCICLNYGSFYSVLGHTEAKSYHYSLRISLILSSNDSISLTGVSFPVLIHFNE